MASVRRHVRHSARALGGRLVRDSQQTGGRLVGLARRLVRRLRDQAAKLAHEWQRAPAAWYCVEHLAIGGPEAAPQPTDGEIKGLVFRHLVKPADGIGAGEGTGGQTASRDVMLSYWRSREAFEAARRRFEERFRLLATPRVEGYVESFSGGSRTFRKQAAHLLIQGALGISAVYGAWSIIKPVFAVPYVELRFDAPYDALREEVSRGRLKLRNHGDRRARAVLAPLELRNPDGLLVAVLLAERSFEIGSGQETEVPFSMKLPERGDHEVAGKVVTRSWIGHRILRRRLGYLVSGIGLEREASTLHPIRGWHVNPNVELEIRPVAAKRAVVKATLEIGLGEAEGLECQATISRVPVVEFDDAPLRFRGVQNWPDPKYHPPTGTLNWTTPPMQRTFSELPFEIWLKSVVPLVGRSWEQVQPQVHCSSHRPEEEG